MTPIYKDALLPLHYSDIPACRSCGHTVGYITRPKPPHAAGIRCLQCQRFIHWLKRVIADDFFNATSMENNDGR